MTTSPSKPAASVEAAKQESGAIKATTAAKTTAKSKPKQPTKKRAAAAKPSPPKSSVTAADQLQEQQQQQQKPPVKKRRRTTPKKGSSSSAKTAAAEKTRPSPTNILIIDNGGDTVKYGWSHEALPRRLPNVTARLKHQWTVLVGDEMEQMAHTNPSQMHSITRSTERGIVTNLGNQIQVWKRMLDLLGVSVPLDSEASQAFGWKATRATKKSKQTPQPQQPQTAVVETTKKKVPASTVAVLLLVPPHCPRTVLDQMMYVWMEDFGVSHMGVATSQVCATKPHPDFHCGCVVDLGWSATHIVPTFRGTAISSSFKVSSSSKVDSKDVDDDNSHSPALAVRRIPLGGRQLVNIWKYYTSYRQWNLMDQDFLMRDLFQQLAYISTDFQGDIRTARGIPSGRRPFDRSFVLPDYQTTFRGQVEIPEALKRQQEAEAREQAQQQQQEEEDNDEEDDDEDFDDDNMQEDDDDDNYDDDDNKSMEDAGGGKSKKRKRRNSKKKKGKEKSDDEDSEDDDDEEEVDEGNNNKEMLRQRLLRQKQEEERRRREQEAEQQVLAVSVERFTIPEVLFNPSDAGLPADMAGLPQAIVQSIKACPLHFQPALFRSIQLTGGLAQLPNLLQRLQREMRALVPGQFEVQISMADAPIDQAWLGAKDWARRTPYTQWISRDDWEAGQKRKVWMKFVSSKGGALV